MTLEQLIGLSLAWFVMMVGLVGCLVPAIPGPSMVLVAAVLHRLYFQDTGAGNWVLIFMSLVTVFSLVLDYIATMVGARKLGATWRGIIGSCIGAIAGAFFGFIFIGIFVGTFLGAVLFELTGGRKLEDATRAGLGALIGLLGGALGKIACSVAMIAVFSVSVVSNSLPQGIPAPGNEPTNRRGARWVAEAGDVTAAGFRSASSTPAREASRRWRASR